jgi:hypothetical protein
MVLEFENYTLIRRSVDILAKNSWGYFLTINQYDSSVDRVLQITIKLQAIESNRIEPNKHCHAKLE